MTSRARLVGGRGGGGGRARGPEGVRRDRVVTRAAEGDGGDGSYPGEEEGRETAGESQRLANEELAKLRSLPLADDAAGENVVGVGGVPQAIVEAERKSKPLRRYRLGAYALASSAAAAQVRTNHRPSGRASDPNLVAWEGKAAPVLLGASPGFSGHATRRRCFPDETSSPVGVPVQSPELGDAANPVPPAPASLLPPPHRSTR